MRQISFYGTIILVGLVMGIILAVQFRATSNIDQNNVPVDRPAALAQELEKARLERDELQERVDQLRVQLDEAAAGPELGLLRDELAQAREWAGLTEVVGAGVEVTLNDSTSAVQPGANPNFLVLHDSDVLSIINELKAGGSKAIAINGQRLISTTEIRCIGPTILVNKNQRLTPPFVISAIGHGDTLVGALKMKGGVVDTLRVWGIQVDVKKSDKVIVPAYTGGLGVEYARPKK